MKARIEKLVFGGQGLARVDGRVAFIWGALPDEDVEFEIIKKKNNFIEGVVTGIITPSPHRVVERDDHYLSCSPWQTLDFAHENFWKQEIAKETYKKIGGIDIGNIDIFFDEREYGYRNKMEYNFAFDTHNKPSLSFHFRGTHRLRPITNCALADSAVEKGSKDVIDWLRQEEFPYGTLKSLIVRSDTRGRAAGALFLKRQHVFKEYPAIGGALSGLEIYVSDFRSPASVPTKLLASSGDTKLESDVRGVKLGFGLLSFFQINPPVFCEALKDISRHIDGGRLVDYYSGVGAISLALHGSYDSAVLVEENSQAAKYALDNIACNKFSNVEAFRSLAEKASVDIRRDDVVIVDPPRIGLHGNVVSMLLEKVPKKIVYLSCGIDTQARDIGLLLKKYTVESFKLYNFFPHTPHIEALCILTRNSSA